MHLSGDEPEVRVVCTLDRFDAAQVHISRDIQLRFQLSNRGWGDGMTDALRGDKALPGFV